MSNIAMTPTERRLLDELEIQKLAAAYSHAVMRRESAAAAAVYTEDGVLSAFYAPDIVGRQAIAAALDTALAPIQWIIQTCSAGVVEVNGDIARASWSVTELLRLREQQELGCCFGVYEDRLARGATGWRFTQWLRALLPWLDPVDRQVVPRAGFRKQFQPLALFRRRADAKALGLPGGLPAVRWPVPPPPAQGVFPAHGFLLIDNLPPSHNN